jgi:hypothetical protein
MSEKIKFHRSDDREAGGALEYGDKEEFFTTEELKDMGILPENDVVEKPTIPPEPPHNNRKSSFASYMEREREREENK